MAKALGSSAANIAKTTITNSVKSSGVQTNRNAGNLFRDEFAELMEKEGYDIQKEVYKKTPFGKRYMDIEVSKNGKVLGGIETKVGGSRYLPAQRAKDNWLRIMEGYKVNVIGKP